MPEAQGIDCIEGVWKRHLFLDLIGAGVLYSDERSISFLALRTNQPQFVQRIIAFGGMQSDINEIGSERLKLFRQIRSKLLAIQPKKNQSAVQSNDVPLHFSKYYESAVLMCSPADGTLLNHDGLIIPIAGENVFEA